MEDIIKLAAQYGPLGLIIVACFWYILFKEKAHRDERKELFDALQKQHDKTIETVEKTNTVLSGTQNVITEIATLIKNK